MENTTPLLKSSPCYLYKKKPSYNLNHFEILTKVKKVGEGTYGLIYHAKTIDGKDIVVKVHILEKTTDFSGNVKELDLLNKLRGHPNIIELKWYSFENPFKEKCRTPMKNKKTKEDKLYFIFDKADYDLETLIYHRTTSFEVLKKIMMQIMISIEYMHLRLIIHRDLKPANFLWFENEKKVKLCDFGLSKIYTYQGTHTPGVVTEYYRPPEVCMKYNKYDYKMDIWSIGCIFYEIIMKKPFIRSRSSSAKNAIILNRILEMIPEKITLKDLERYNSANKEIKIISKNISEIIFLTEEKKKEFNKTSGSLADFSDLIKKLLKFHPEDRFSATEALDHVFFEGFRDEINELRNQLYEPGISQEVILCKRPESKFVRNISCKLFKEREDCVWYSHRVIFLAMDIFERYLEFYLKTNEEVMTQLEIWLKFTVCVYLSIKYFTSLTVPPSFSEILPTKYRSDANKILSEDFERELLTKVLDKGIYRGTLYECSDEFKDVLDDLDVGELLNFYLNYECEKGMNIRELYKVFRSGKGKITSPLRFNEIEEIKMIPTIKTLKESRLVIRENKDDD